jgi:signal transduction histidine kinase/CheY-like chemotaxis protein
MPPAALRWRLPVVVDPRRAAAQNATGEILKWFGTCTDIQDIKQSELEKEALEAQNRQLQKSESLGRMAGAIAHHFNNQLQAVMMNLWVAMKNLPAGSGHVENLTEAMQSARKAAEVSTLMLTYLGLTVTKRELLDFSDICQQSLPMLRAVMPKDVLLETDLPMPGPVVQANANQMQQVLTNLVTNACEACANGRGTVRLTLKIVNSAKIPTANRFPVDWQPQQNDYACLDVIDFGCGIAPQDIDKLFDPFFSSKFVGRGLGLPVVLGIVRGHGGVITVKSEPSLGSVFRVFLPLSEKAAPQKPISMVQEPKTGWSGTVLVVDDEANLRKVVATAIKSLGFAVVEAQDGVQAVDMFRQHQGEIRLVLCDLTMPRMDGWQTLSALRKLSPCIPVILASGYSEAQVMAGNHPELPQAFLSKPYEFETLRDAISRVLALMER